MIEEEDDDDIYGGVNAHYVLNNSVPVINAAATVPPGGVVVNQHINTNTQQTNSQFANNNLSYLIFKNSNRPRYITFKDNLKIELDINNDGSAKLRQKLKNDQNREFDIPYFYFLELGSGSQLKNNTHKTNKKLEGCKIIMIKDKFYLFDQQGKLYKIQKGDNIEVSNCKFAVIDEFFVKFLVDKIAGGVDKFFKDNKYSYYREHKDIKPVLERLYPQYYNKEKQNDINNDISQGQSPQYPQYYQDNQYPYYQNGNGQFPMYPGDYGLNYGQPMYQGDNFDNVIGIDGLGEINLNRPMEMYIQEPGIINGFIKTNVKMQEDTYVLYIAGVLSLGAGALIFGLATSIPIAVPIALAVAGVVSIVANVCINASKEVQNRENILRAGHKNRILQNEFFENNGTKKQRTNVNSCPSQIQPIYIMPQNTIPSQNTNTLQPQPQQQK